MSDIMRPMPFGQLMNWAMEEYGKSGSLFGVAEPVRHTDGQALPIFDEKIEAPFGPAAGPHTQLAQNIIAAYAAGARFFELKTVQQMDGPELAACVNKPCITAGDECYNCEWSTELYVPQAYAEYVKAWVACRLLAKEYGLGDPDAFVFNMSVGYDLAGIKSEKINAFIDGMIEAKNTEAFRECVAWARENTGRFRNVDAAYVEAIPSRISCSITESTLHGCPPDEIERIATYLITEKHLNTYIKLNPTLLGYEYARSRLDSLGFDYVHFDDRHFREDLQWKDAVPMLERLTALAKEKGLEFGVKLTNTFPVDVKQNELPSEEMYMAGRALFPLTIHLAARISETFGGKLRISYSG
ncbi:MAG: putative selenate reductase subunit YgfK, partial [Clostridia bacterium]|nr:putative selenate reductase subunit YgfK [Clostridia bacterium]